MQSLAYDSEAKLKAMSFTARALNEHIQVIREEDYLIVEHEDYGHVMELHLDDYDIHKQLLREALAALVEGDTPPW